MRVSTSVVLSVVAVLSLGASAEAAKKAEEQAIKKALVIYSEQFTVPSEMANEAWARAIEWLLLVSDEPPPLWTDYSIRTFDAWDTVHCNVVRWGGEENVTFTARCSPPYRSVAVPGKPPKDPQKTAQELEHASWTRRNSPAGTVNLSRKQGERPRDVVVWIS